MEIATALLLVDLFPRQYQKISTSKHLQQYRFLVWLAHLLEHKRGGRAG